MVDLPASNDFFRQLLPREGGQRAERRVDGYIALGNELRTLKMVQRYLEEAPRRGLVLVCRQLSQSHGTSEFRSDYPGLLGGSLE